MPEIKKPKIFISYSHADEEWKDFIKGFFNKNIFDLWDDGCIEYGDNWFKKINDSLHDCDIALLLLSKDFINSKFINEKEIPVFLNRHEEEGVNVRIIPIFLRPYDYGQISWISEEEGRPFAGFISPEEPLSNYFESSFKYSYELEEKIAEFTETLRTLYNKDKHPSLANYYENTQPNNTKEEILSSQNNKTNNIFLHFRQDKLDDNKYFVDIYARYKEVHLNKTYRDVVLEDINSQESQQKLMEILYQFRKNIPIHFIVPPELYLENFKLWMSGRRKLKGLFHPIYLHSDTRYSQDVDEYSFMIEDEWRPNFQPDDILKDSLEALSSDDSEYDIITDKIGVCFKYYPKEEIIEEHLDIAKIALWFNQESTAYQTWLEENCYATKLNKLPDKLIKCDYASLLWDDMSMLIDLKKELQQ